jgi:hypothetical protein
MPAEHHRRVGRANGTKKADGRPLPALAEVVQLPMADDMPEYPGDLDDDGREMWRRIWQHGLTWISPNTDLAAAEEACRACDDLAVARRRYRATADPKDATALAALGKRLDLALSQLGFNPTARARLGVAEVTRVSKLDALRRSRDA